MGRYFDIAIWKLLQLNAEFFCFVRGSACGAATFHDFALKWNARNCQDGFLLIRTISPVYEVFIIAKPIVSGSRLKNVPQETVARLVLLRSKRTD